MLKSLASAVLFPMKISLKAHLYFGDNLKRRLSSFAEVSPILLVNVPTSSHFLIPKVWNGFAPRGNTWQQLCIYLSKYVHIHKLGLWTHPSRTTGSLGSARFLNELKSLALACSSIDQVKLEQALFKPLAAARLICSPSDSNFTYLICRCTCIYESRST